MESRRKFVVLISVLFVAITCSRGEIKNGYASRIDGMRESLRNLHAMLHDDPNLSLFQKAAIKNGINKLASYISYFELTDELLYHFKTVAPEMYHEINNLKSSVGQGVTIYVKFVPESEIEHGARGNNEFSSRRF